MFSQYGNFAGGYGPGQSSGEQPQRIEFDVRQKESNMGSDAVNVFTPPAEGGGGLAAMIPAAMMAGMGGNRGYGDGLGGGLGMGLVGGLLGGLIFGRGGIGGFGDRGVVDGCGRHGDCLTPEMAATTAMGLNTAIAGTTAAVMASTDKLAGGQMMLMNATNAGFASQGQMTLQQTIMMIQQMNVNQQTLLTELCGVNQNVSSQGCMTREAIVNDGDRTRALLTSRFQLEDQTEINKLNAKVIELQNEHRQRELGTKIEIQNTAIAAQQQGQQQQQLQGIFNGVQQLFPLVQGVLQVAHATNTNVVAGNTGATTIAAQTATASPTNVNA